MTTRVLFVSWYTGLGGGETDLLSLAAGLTADGGPWEPHLLLPRPGQLGDKWAEYGWSVHITPWRGVTTFFVPAIWERLPVVGRMADLITREHITIVHSNYHTLPMAVAAARRAAVPLMWTCHGWWFQPKPWQRDFFRQIPGAARSEAIQRGFLGDPPFMPPDKLPVIYSGVDTNRFRPGLNGGNVRQVARVPDTAPLVAMAARFQRVKGHHTFQAMAREVLTVVPDAHFVVAGENVFGGGADDAYKRRILQQAQDDPLLRARLHYIGFRDDVEQVYSAADVVVCASDFESYGKAVIEAMACGVPVVSSDAGGPQETIVHGETGWLVPAGDAMHLADRVIGLLRDADERRRFGEAGRARVLAHFSDQATTAAYAQMFTDLLTR